VLDKVGSLQTRISNGKSKHKSMKAQKKLFLRLLSLRSTVSIVLQSPLPHLCELISSFPYASTVVDMPHSIDYSRNRYSTRAYTEDGYDRNGKQDITDSSNVGLLSLGCTIVVALNTPGYLQLGLNAYQHHPELHGTNTVDP
jgi:hypothetical protein